MTRQTRDRNEHGRAEQGRPRDALGRPLPYGTSGVEPIDDTPRSPVETLLYARQLLDQGRPFGAHEALEVRWKSCPSEERDLWQGLAQLAVAITHRERGNVIGAQRLHALAAVHLENYKRTGDTAYGVDLDRVVESVRRRVEAPTAAGDRRQPGRGGAVRRAGS